MPETRVAFAGAGYIASRHVEALSHFEDVAVIGIADPVGERAERLAVRCEAEACSSLDELLERSDPDALYICVPPFAHGEPEAKAIERGLPIFVEKPLSLGVATAREINDAVATQRVVTAVGYHWRYLDVVSRARDLLQERPVRMALAHWLTSTPGSPWWIQQALSGGQILEQATHLVDLARYLVGEVLEVQARGSSIRRDRFLESDIFDTSVATLQFDTGALGVLASTFLLNASHRIGLHLIAEELSLEILARGPGGTAPFELVIDRGDGIRVETDATDPFLLENRDFIDAVQGKENRIRVPYEEALKSHEVAAAAALATLQSGGRAGSPPLQPSEEGLGPTQSSLNRDLRKAP